MTRHWTPLAVVYLVLAVAGLVVTWTFNAIAIAEGIDDVKERYPASCDLSTFALRQKAEMAVLKPIRLEGHVLWQASIRKSQAHN